MAGLSTGPASTTGAETIAGSAAAGQGLSLASAHVSISCRQSVVPVADILPPRTGEKKGGPTCGPPMGADQKKFQVTTSCMYRGDCETVASPKYGILLPGVLSYRECPLLSVCLARRL